jgi:23S rRNA (uracil1939-C5)-methyltransferase
MVRTRWRGWMFSQDRVLDLFCGWATLPCRWRKAAQRGGRGRGAGAGGEGAGKRREWFANVTFFHENLEEDVTRQPGRSTVLIKCCSTRRAPAPGVMPHIIKLAPRRVVYVSCNPATLARDSETLLQAGYQIQRLAMLDMFPHTGHLESMVLFEHIINVWLATCRMTCRKLRLADFGRPVP